MMNGPSQGDENLCLSFVRMSFFNTKGMFVPASQLAFPVEKLKSQKQEQTANFLTGFWNVEKQASKEMN
jgi:hypothetical protein